MIRSTILAAVAVFVAVGVAGCYESTNVTLSQPGQYKGQKDPLLAQQTSSRSEALKKRFQLVQLDR